MADASSVSDKQKKKRVFNILSHEEKQKILDKHHAKNIAESTKLWMNAFHAFLEAEKLPEVNDISTDELPSILENFYGSMQKTEEEKYKNSLKVIRASINCFFKEKRNLDIISDQCFIQYNEFFKGLLKEGKDQGYGDIKSKDPICDADMEKLTAYFTHEATTKFSAATLQEILLFYIIFSWEEEDERICKT